MKRSGGYIRRRFLCSAGEWRFYEALEKAVGTEYTIMMKVRVAALLQCRESDWESLGRRVSQKEFDFVLVRRGSSFAACAIELDDRTHERLERRARDELLERACAEAGLPLVRQRVARVVRGHVLPARPGASSPSSSGPTCPPATGAA